MLNCSIKVLDQVKGLIKIQDEVLNSKPGALGPGTALTTKITAARTGVITVYQQCVFCIKSIYNSAQYLYSEHTPKIYQP